MAYLIIEGCTNVVHLLPRSAVVPPSFSYGHRLSSCCSGITIEPEGKQDQLMTTLNGKQIRALQAYLLIMCLACSLHEKKGKRLRRRLNTSLDNKPRRRGVLDRQLKSLRTKKIVRSNTLHMLYTMFITFRPEAGKYQLEEILHTFTLFPNLRKPSQLSTARPSQYRIPYMSA